MYTKVMAMAFFVKSIVFVVFFNTDFFKMEA